MSVNEVRQWVDGDTISDELIEETKSLKWQMFDFQEFIKASRDELRETKAFLCISERGHLVVMTPNQTSPSYTEADPKAWARGDQEVENEFYKRLAIAYEDLEIKKGNKPKHIEVREV